MCKSVPPRQACSEHHRCSGLKLHVTEPLASQLLPTCQWLASGHRLPQSHKKAIVVRQEAL